VDIEEEGEVGMKGVLEVEEGGLRESGLTELASQLEGGLRSLWQEGGIFSQQRRKGEEEEGE